jgi:hypothetical protein
MNQRFRLLIAIVGGSAAAALLVAVVTCLVGFTAGGLGQALFWLAAAGMWALGYFAIALTASSTIGLAWHAFASRRRWTNVHAYWVPGALFGASVPAAALLLPLLVSGATPYSDITISLAQDLGGIGFFLGTATGFFVWFIRRPDRDDAASKPA